MPFYEYQCKSCGHELEAMQKVSDPPMRKCPHCGKSQLQRLMSAPVFRLKGGGWYETDFKGDKDNQRNLADRPEESAKETKDADSKPKDDKAADSNAGDAKASDGKAANGKDGKAADSKSAEAPAAKESTAKEKSTGKSAEKSSGGGGGGSGAQKPAAPNRSSRGGRLKKKSIKIKRRR
jgi:putative FmdB family regulatory protein